MDLVQEERYWFSKPAPCYLSFAWEMARDALFCAFFLVLDSILDAESFVWRHRQGIYFAVMCLLVARPPASVLNLVVVVGNYFGVSVNTVQQSRAVLRPNATITHSEH